MATATAIIPAGWSRTKDFDNYTATWAKQTACGACPDTYGESYAIEVWYDVHTRAWVVMAVSVEGYQTGPAEYVLEGKRDAFIVAERWAGCPH